jgi:pterin-4a-carbinolamine dehydratase
MTPPVNVEMRDSKLIISGGILERQRKGAIPQTRRAGESEYRVTRRVDSPTVARRQPINPGWHRVGLSLVRELSFRDFEEAFAFATRVAHEAVDYLRRPDICVFGFNRVRLTIANPRHAGLTEAEWRLVRKVDAILTTEPAAQRTVTDGRP